MTKDTDKATATGNKARLDDVATQKPMRPNTPRQRHHPVPNPYVKTSRLFQKSVARLNFENETTPTSNSTRKNNHTMLLDNSLTETSVDTTTNKVGVNYTASAKKLVANTFENPAKNPAKNLLTNGEVENDNTKVNSSKEDDSIIEDDEDGFAVPPPIKVVNKDNGSGSAAPSNNIDTPTKIMEENPFENLIGEDYDDDIQDNADLQTEN